ncbi:MAG TPA: hypothetical protein VES88_01660 [Gemmatimonadaceae bacterium]|nr:hypothetical protein [Gemmatimonadaceae bacterium]
MFQQAFKNIDHVLRKEAGCTTELDYTEQTSWLLFLKNLDGLEQDKATEAALAGKRIYDGAVGSAGFLEAPYIIHTNTLSENLADIQEKDRYDVVRCVIF